MLSGVIILFGVASSVLILLKRVKQFILESSMWNADNVDRFFGNDDVFLNNYTSQLLRGRIGNAINIESLRGTLRAMSLRFPNLDQTTPEWIIPTNNRLLVVFGRAFVNHNRYFQTNQPRIGLYGYNGSVHLWTDLNLIKTACRAGWTAWPRDDGHKHYSNVAVTADNVIQLLENCVNLGGQNQGIIGLNNNNQTANQKGIAIDVDGGLVVGPLYPRYKDLWAGG